MAPVPIATPDTVVEEPSDTLADSSGTEPDADTTKKTTKKKNRKKSSAGKNDFSESSDRKKSAKKTRRTADDFTPITGDENPVTVKQAATKPTRKKIATTVRTGSKKTDAKASDRKTDTKPDNKKTDTKSDNRKTDTRSDNRKTDTKTNSKKVNVKGDSKKTRRPTSEGEKERTTTPKPNDSKGKSQVESKPVAKPKALQVGAFQSPEEAQRMRARMALLGVETEVQEAKTKGNRVVHRLRTSSHSKRSDLEETRRLLNSNNIKNFEVNRN